MKKFQFRKALIRPLLTQRPPSPVDTGEGSARFIAAEEDKELAPEFKAELDRRRANTSKTDYVRLDTLRP